MENKNRKSIMFITVEIMGKTFSCKRFNLEININYEKNEGL